MSILLRCQKINYKFSTYIVLWTNKIKIQTICKTGLSLRSKNELHDALYMANQYIFGKTEYDKINFKIYNNNYLTISATRNNESEEKKDNYIRRERSYGSVSRGFYISNVNKDSIKAKFDNGVLNIELPKKELTANNSTQILIE